MTNYSSLNSNANNTTLTPKNITYNNNSSPLIFRNSSNPSVAPTISHSMFANCSCDFTTSPTSTPTSNDPYAEFNIGYRLLAGLLLPIFMTFIALKISKVNNGVEPGTNKNRYMRYSGIGSFLFYILAENAIIAATAGAGYLCALYTVIFLAAVEKTGENLLRNEPKISLRPGFHQTLTDLESERSGQVNPVTASIGATAAATNRVTI